MSVILALDQGTSSSRAVIVGSDSKIVAVAQRELPQIYPQPGWVEQDPEAIWSSQLAAIRAVMEQAHLTTRDIAAVGITNQRETTVVWDRATGQPIFNALVWQGKPWVIDFPQAVDPRFSPHARRLLDRDLGNLARWFERHGAGFDAERTAESLWRRWESGRL